MKKTGFPAHRLDAESADSDKIAPRRTGALSRCSYPSRQRKYLCQRSGSSSCVVCNEGWDEDGALMVGKERIQPPGIEQVFEADAKVHGNDGAHRLAVERLETVACVTDHSCQSSARECECELYCARNWGMGVSSVSCEVDDDRNRLGGGRCNIFVWGRKMSYSNT